MTTDEAKAEAARLWASFNESERAGVRVGMFPLAKMHQNTPHSVTCALMEIAAEGAPPNTAKPLRRKPRGRPAEMADALAEGKRLSAMRKGRT